MWTMLHHILRVVWKWLWWWYFNQVRTSYDKKTQPKDHRNDFFSFLWLKKTKQKKLYFVRRIIGWIQHQSKQGGRFRNASVVCFSFDMFALGCLLAVGREDKKNSRWRRAKKNIINGKEIKCPLVSVWNQAGTWTNLNRDLQRADSWRLINPSCHCHWEMNEPPSCFCSRSCPWIKLSFGIGS